MLGATLNNKNSAPSRDDTIMYIWTFIFPTTSFIFFSSELLEKFVQSKILLFIFPGLCDICIWRPFGVCISQLCLKVWCSEASQEKSPKAMGVRPLFIRSYPYGGCHASSGYIQQWRIFCDGKYQLKVCTIFQFFLVVFKAEKDKKKTFKKIHSKFWKSI